MSTLEDFLRMTTMILLIGIGSLAVSCTSSPSTTRFLVDQPDRTVGMEVTYREGSLEYSHPITLNPDIFDQVFQAIEVQPSSLLDRITGSSSLSQVAFTKEQRIFFAKHLSAAFKKTTPLETVTFYWATPRGNGIWEVTSGGLYFQGNDLHLVLPNFREAIPAKTLPQIPRDHPLSQIGESLHSLKAIAPARHTHGVGTELWSLQIPHFVFSLKELWKDPKKIVDQPAPPAKPSLNSSGSSKQRLQTLEELRQEGLLSDEEFQHKQQEILEQL